VPRAYDPLNLALHLPVWIKVGSHWRHVRARQRRAAWGKWGNLPQAPSIQGPPTDRFFHSYYHLAGLCRQFVTGAPKFHCPRPPESNGRHCVNLTRKYSFVRVNCSDHTFRERHHVTTAARQTENLGENILRGAACLSQSVSIYVAWIFRRNLLDVDTEKLDYVQERRKIYDLSHLKYSDKYGSDVYDKSYFYPCFYFLAKLDSNVNWVLITIKYSLCCI
jgi:hypothetical protein